MNQTTFSYTGSSQTFRVPSGVTQVQATVVGGGGGSFNGVVGGKGGVVTTFLNVSGLDTIDVFVAGVGSSGTGTGGGGGGGGASVLSKTINSQTTYYVIAGGVEERRNH